MQKSLFGKVQPQKTVSRSDEIIIKKHAECWHRWVQCRVWYRDLKNNNKPVKWLEIKLNGTHYTLDAYEFKIIEKEYIKLKQ